MPLDSIEKTVEYFKTNNVDFIHSNSINFWSNREEHWVPYKHKLYKNISNTIPTLKNMVEVNRIHGGTVVYKKECFKDRLFDETLWTAEEWEFNMWLLKNNYKLGYLDAFTYRYRRHDNQKSLGKKANQVERNKVFKIIRQKYGFN